MIETLAPIVAILAIIGLPLAAVAWWRYTRDEIEPLPIEIPVTSTAGFTIGSHCEIRGDVYQVVAVDRHRRRLTLIRTEQTT